MGNLSSKNKKHKNSLKRRTLDYSIEPPKAQSSESPIGVDKTDFDISFDRSSKDAESTKEAKIFPNNSHKHESNDDLPSFTCEDSMGMTPESTTLRKEGNTHYQNAHIKGLAPVIKKERLQKAIRCYDKAIQESPTGTDLMASATKNYAKANWALAETIGEHEKNFNEAAFYFREAITYVTKALLLGQRCMGIDWTRDLSTSFRTCMDSALKTIAPSPVKNRLAFIESYIHCMDDDSLRADCFHEMAKIIFHHAVVSLEAGDFRTSLWALKECYRPIEEVKRCARGRYDLLEEATVIENDVVFHTASAESLQAIVTGDNLLEVVLKNEESLNMDMVYEVIDWYKKAVILTKELEVEREAIASSRLGKLYDQVLKLKFKAKVYCEACMQLAHSLTPRMFTTEDWFRTAADILGRYQKESIVNQQEQDRKDKQKYLEELKDELKKLEELVTKNRGDDAGLILAIYKEFPPKNSSHVPPEEKELKEADLKGLKKALQKAVLHYHPDKQDKDTHGKKWVVFCDEITKVFTRRYEHYKLGD